MVMVTELYPNNHFGVEKNMWLRKHCRANVCVALKMRTKNPCIRMVRAGEKPKDYTILWCKQVNNLGQVNKVLGINEQTDNM